MNILRKFLFPFSWLYGTITALRNLFYDKGWLKSTSYNLPVVCVGNLSAGGTGKSPMIEFLIEFLKNEYRVGVLSRGYKRLTNGYIEVLTDSTADQVGDEPRQFKQNFPKVKVAVCEDRRTGIEQLKKEVDIVLLDDAFQHRKVTASTNIILSTFDNLYLNDSMLPAGNLREYASGAQRADFIVVTKCPENVPYATLQEIEFKMKLMSHQRLYFAKIGYESMIHGISEKLPLAYLEDKPFTLVTGIANPKPLLEFLQHKEFNFEHKKYPDHHYFSDSEINRLKEKDLIITTEKDFMRLQARLDKFAIYYLPIKTIILNEQESFFKEAILKQIRSFSGN